jgi:hypothetical protein
MKPERLLRHLRAGAADKRSLHDAGALVGNELPRRRVEVLQQARAALARFDLPEKESYAAGYAAALADVVAAFEVATSQDREVATNADALVRSGVRDVIGIMREGVELPSAIAERLGKPREVVSRTLSQMRESGLAEDFDPPAGSDQRMRPHRLTARGEGLADQLPSTFPDGTARGIAFSVRAFGRLARVATTTKTGIEELATDVFQGVLTARGAAQAFVESASAEGVIETKGDSISLLPSRADEQARLVDLIERACNDDQSALLERLRQVVDGGLHLLVRPNATSKRSWRLLLATTRSGVWGKIRVVERPELDPMEAGQRFAVLYDHVTALTEDEENAAVSKLYARAERKLCIASKATHVPGKTERVEFETLS